MEKNTIEWGDVSVSPHLASLHIISNSLPATLPVCSFPQLQLLLWHEEMSQASSASAK